MGVFDQFKLDGKVVVITGGAGLLGYKHAQMVCEAGGTPVLWDVNEQLVLKREADLAQEFDAEISGMQVDITNAKAVQTALDVIIKKFKKVDVLINNAAHDPKVVDETVLGLTRLENFSLEQWNSEVNVGLTGSFICSQVIGRYMAQHDGGVILNISSDLGVIAPDQRIYRKEGLKDEDQPVKPVTYSVIKHGLIGLTKYLATYWADKNIRVNAICPGGVYNGQADEFTKKLTNLIPMGRMAGVDEYKAAVLFLITDASSYMTGASLNIDGGRSCW